MHAQQIGWAGAGLPLGYTGQAGVGVRRPLSTFDFPRVSPMLDIQPADLARLVLDYLEQAEPQGWAGLPFPAHTQSWPTAPQPVPPAVDLDDTWFMWRAGA